jgi:hypothetical protein
VNNTFGIKGVDQYCNFFKSIEDANALRNRVSECFERAALPATPESVRSSSSQSTANGMHHSAAAMAMHCMLCMWTGGAGAAH